MVLRVRAVVFDVDGVLIDSLPQHLQICRDKAAEFGLDLAIPSVAEFRRMIGSGVKVSPMIEFFRAVGFPEDDAQKAVGDYQREFMWRYRPAVFPGTGEMLAVLHGEGLRLGLVTSNTRANVEPALGSAMTYFDDAAQFYLDSFSQPKSKAWCLGEIARVFDTSASDCAYVGDQPVDAAAASEAGFQFLGAAYGWGLPAQTADMELAATIDEMPSRFLVKKGGA